MTVKEAFDSIVEDGIALGAGDFVDPEALEVAATIMAKVLRGKLVKVVRCKDCKHYKPRKQSAHWEQTALCCTRTAWMTFPPDGFCSYGERRTDERKAD